MAIKRMTLACDHCYEEADDYESLDEALECGWFVLQGPERELGGDGERVYCSRYCLESDL